MRARVRRGFTQVLLAATLLSGCAEAALTSDFEDIEDFDSFDATVTLPLDAGQDGALWSDDAAPSPWPDSGVTFDAGGEAPDSDGEVSDAEAADATAPDANLPDASTPDASTPDAGPADAGPGDASAADASAPDAGPVDAGQPDASRPDAGGTCSPQTCTNDCSIGAPFKCCKGNGTCGCSWFSVAYCS